MIGDFIAMLHESMIDSYSPSFDPFDEYHTSIEEVQHLTLTDSYLRINQLRGTKSAPPQYRNPR